MRLTERDRWILEALGKMRFLRTGQLARLGFGGSRWATNKRLRRLFDAGLVRAWLRDGNLAEENLYTLTRTGVARISWIGAAPCRLDGNLDHVLAINQVRIAFILTLSEAGGELVSWQSDWEIVRGRNRAVVPDALCVVRWGDGDERTYAIEVDRASRSVRGFLKKAVAYGARRWADAILVVGTDSRWVAHYRRAADTAAPLVPLWFTTLQALEQVGAGGAVWWAAGSRAPVSLRHVLTVRPRPVAEPRADSLVAADGGARRPPLPL